MLTKESLLTKSAIAASIVLAIGSAFCGITLLYYFYHYTWIRERRFAGWDGPVLAYILPTVLGSLMFAAMRLSRLVKIEASIVILLIAAAIYTGEFILLGEEALGKARAAREHGIGFDLRTRFEVVSDLRKNGISAVPAIAPSNLLQQKGDGTRKSVIRIGGDEILPFGGIADKTTVHCNENGDYTIYVSDQHGFHNPRGIWNARRTDIAGLGDSFTLGSCVPPDKNFMALIRQHYPATLNLGSIGIGPLIELAILKEYLLPSVKPKVLLWFYFEGNDLSNLSLEEKSPLLRRYLDSEFSQNLPARQTQINQALTAYVENEMAKEVARQTIGWQSVIKLSHLRQRLDLLQGDFGNKSTAEILMLFSKILAQAKTRVIARGGEIYFVYLPDWSRYSKLAVAEKTRDPVLTLIRNLEIPLIDIHEAFQAQKDPLALFPFRRSGHYNEDGHRLVAQEVLRAISKQADP
jgi:hypothetical protein